MNKKLLMLMMAQFTVVLLCAGVLAYTGQSDLEDTIRALDIMTGRSPSETIAAEEDIDGDGKIGLAEAIYWMQDAAGIPYTDLDAQDYEQDFLLSALALEMTVGERLEIVALDTPRVGNDDQAYNREDLIFTPIKGETVAQVEIEDLTDSEEDTYYYIRGLAQGVAVFQISYDGYTGQKPLVAVNVTAADAAGPVVETDILLTKYDIVYFTEESVDFTFTVTADEEATITAEVNGTLYTTTDGGFTVPLINGYNPIIITAVGATGTTTKVINLRAKKCAYTITNLTRSGSDVFYEGDTINLDFTGLAQPVPKVSRIYNPNANRITYDFDMPRYSVITGDSAQYSIDNVEMELTAAGTYTFTNGHLAINWFGSGLYSETPVGTAEPVTDAAQTDYDFSVLPDIQITVQENSEYAPVLFTSAVQNTEEIWPGDEVVITIEDLDIETIDENHPEDDGSYWISSLIDSYTIFATDIPGLDTVTSEHAEINMELANLKTISFVVPEDTAPGTYQVRGGYAYVKWGPTWWTRVTYYFKGTIPDITIEVKEAVPGQVHGAVSFESETLKSRLAEALGLGADYTGDLTTAELKTLTGALDLSDSGITDADMTLMQYLTGVTAIDLSGNPDITSETVKKETFDWTLEKSLDFSGCTGLTELAGAAFYECANLVGIVLPDSITSLGANCFDGCTRLAAITLPTAIETIGDYCFRNCQALTRIIIPDGVTALGNYVFFNGSSLQNIQLPGYLETIGDYCFYGCQSITEITLPETLTALGYMAFAQCSALSMMALPAVLETIDTAAFAATGITLVDLRDTQFTADQGTSWGLNSDAIVYLSGADAQLDTRSAVLKLGEETLTLTHQIPDSETVTWGSTDTEVAVVSSDGLVAGVTAGTAYVYVITADDTYSDYCKVTFEQTDTPGLLALSLSEDNLNETFDPQRLFYTANMGCYTTEIRVAATLAESTSVLKVNGLATADNTASESVALAMGDNIVPVEVTTGETTKTYYILISVEEIYEGDTALSHANAAFAGKLATAAGKEAGYIGPLTYAELAAIQGELDLSDLGLTDADMVVMQYLSGVSAINLSGNTALTADAVDMDFFNWTSLTRLDFTGCTAITEIPGSAFLNCSTLTEIVLPDSVTTLGSHSFRNCSALTTINFPAMLREIGSYAFRDATSLTSVVLPAGLTSIDVYVFQDCTGLCEADLSLVSPEALAGSIGMFRDCTGISDMSKIKLPADLTRLPELFFYGCSGITQIVLPDAVTAFSYAAFRNCTGIEAVDLTNITELGNSVFAGCTSLASITFPANITSLPEMIFQDCTALTAIDLPETLTSIGRVAFRGCIGLTAIDLPDSLTEIGDAAFRECTGLKTMEFSDNVITLGEDVLRDCTGLTSVRLPGNMTTLGERFFYGCTSLSEVALPDTITVIDRFAFRNSGITWLAVPVDVTEIGSRNFDGCTALAILDLSATAFTAVDSDWAVPDTATVLMPGQDAGLSPSTSTMLVDGTVTLTHIIPEGTSVTWVSSNTAVATVTAEGLVTGVAAGSAVIAVKADDDSYNGTCTVTVTAAP